jgi:hypothetical protein
MPVPPIITSPGGVELDGRGSFVVGSTAVLFFTFTDVNGDLYDPSDIDVTIKDPDDVEVETFTETDKLAFGKFVIAWDIDESADTGKYTLEVDYTYETASGSGTASFTENFVVLDATADYVSLRTTSWRSYLEILLGTVQHIPVFHEPARLNRAKTVATLTFPGGVKSGPWNQQAGVKVWVNDEERESGFSVDYLKGQVFFDNALSDYDQVMVSYNFRWFKDAELDALIQQSINLFNNWPPHSSYHIGNIPERYGIAVFWGAAVDAIRRWMMDVLFQEPTKIFGSPERAQAIFGQMDTLKKNYEEWLEKILEQKKYGPYVGLTRTITVPEYTLPGGRSRWFRYLFKTAT